jgi:hypothetical protein
MSPYTYRVVKIRYISNLLLLKFVALYAVSIALPFCKVRYKQGCSINITHDIIFTCLWLVVIVKIIT